MKKRNLNNLTHQAYQIDRSSYEKRNGHRGIALWFTGLSGSGKSTLANGLHQKLFEIGMHSIVLDGDNTRLGINKDLGFTNKDRIENLRRVAEITKLFVETGHIVITAFISPFKENRIQAKKIISENDFLEVYIDSTLETCENRDVKGLYKKARLGEIKDFTGVSSPYEKPDSADIQINTNKSSIPESVELLFKQLNSKI
ncbi:adenylyl-sulfate kinase [Crocinitomicaceae bacterium]|nr:adenylyl-sulfate kinase [Crocinitomicaceae bacterium]